MAKVVTAASVASSTDAAGLGYVAEFGGEIQKSGLVFDDVLNDDGSSPRLWGTLIRDVRSDESVRFIPSRVGNTV